VLWLSTTPWRRIGGVYVQLHSFFDLGARWRWVVSFTTRPLYPQGKNPWYPLDRGLGGPQNRSGRSGKEINSNFINPFTPTYFRFWFSDLNSVWICHFPHVLVPWKAGYSLSKWIPSQEGVFCMKSVTFIAVFWTIYVHTVCRIVLFMLKNLKHLSCLSVSICFINLCFPFVLLAWYWFIYKSNSPIGPMKMA
jgi:hypothetical protein